MRQNRAITEKKYAAFIEECFHKKTFDLKQMLQKHSVDGSLITTLSKLGLVVVVNKGVYNWIGNIACAPTQEEVNEIIQLHRDRAKAYKEKRDQRKTEEVVHYRVGQPSPPSLTIEEQEKQAVDFLKSLGSYEIYRVERRQL